MSVPVLHASSSPLVGRDAPIARLLQSFKQAESGQGAVALIRGDGGIGKSRVTSEIVHRTARMGALSLTGHATSFDRGVPFGLAREIVGDLPAGLPDGLADRVTTVRSLLHGTTPVGAGVRSEQVPQDVLSAMFDLLTDLAEHETAVMVWEDLHEADSDSVALLMRLARLLAHTRVLVLATTRPRSRQDIVGFERLVEQLEQEGRGVTIDLEPLDRSDVRALVADSIGAVPEGELVDVIYDASLGNPFFVTETTRSLLRSASVEVDEHRGRLVRLQPTLRPRTAVVHRFFQIGSTEANVAKVIAAFGRVSPRELDLVASITGIPEQRVIESFDRLVSEQLMVKVDERYEFAHSILREALYDDIGPGERRRVHSIIAEHLRRQREAGLPVDITELATHVSECADHNDPVAIDVLFEAGRVTARSAPLVSARWFSKCAELIAVDDPRVTTIRAHEASAMFAASLPADAARLGRAALEHMPPGPERTRTLSDTVISLYICGALQEAIDVIDAEERESGGLSPLLQAQRANHEAQLGREAAGAPADHEITSPELGTERRAVTMIYDLHRAGLCGDHATVRALTERLHALSSTASVPTQIAIHSADAVEQAFLYEATAAREALDAAALLRIGDRRLSIAGQLETAEIVVRYLEGRWDDALERVSDVTWNLRQSQTRVLEGWMQNAACEMLLARGDVKRAAAIAAEFHVGTETIRQAFDATRGNLLIAQGEPAKARHHLEQALDRMTGSGLPYGLHGVLDVLVDASVATGDRSQAVHYLDQLDAVAMEADLTIAHFRRHHARARLLGDVDAAHAAHQLIATTPLRFHSAVAQLTLAEVDDSSSPYLIEAHQTFDELNALPWRQRAAAALRQAGLSVPRSTEEHGGLSETERCLARLVADGLTNREIAVTMHYSVKTVEVYLTRLYAKTECRSRLELARAVDRGDIIVERTV